MKNLKRFLTLCLALSMMLSVTAFAAAGDPETIKEIVIEDDYAEKVTTDCKDGDVNFELTYTKATNGGMYLILVLSKEGLPENGNILYVNQGTADNEGITFDNVYPMEIGDENSHIYIAGTDVGYDKIATIIPNVEEDTVLKGDVTGDGKVNMADVIAIRRYLVNKEKYPLTVYDAGDVTADEKINMADAIAIRRYLVNKDKYPLK